MESVAERKQYAKFYILSPEFGPEFGAEFGGKGLLFFIVQKERLMSSGYWVAGV